MFLAEAFASGAFDRLVVAETNQSLVDGLRSAGGSYSINVAQEKRMEHRQVHGVEIYNPSLADDRQNLFQAVAEASEMASALPSVATYDLGGTASPAAVLAGGLRLKREQGGPGALLYAGENDLTAAAKLVAAINRHCPAGGLLACLDTVIGKMSGTVTGQPLIESEGLTPFVPGAGLAFRVESFNRIRTGPVPRSGFQRQLTSFIECPDLPPFAQAKLYGHNAAHALLGYRLEAEGHDFICEARSRPTIIEDVREAFFAESGKALRHKFSGLDNLFTNAGFASHVNDLMQRMTNPFLHDTVKRVTRDPARKLAWNDRLIGAMRLALAQGIEPRRFAVGAGLALARWLRDAGLTRREGERKLWPEAGVEEKRQILDMLE